MTRRYSVKEGLQILTGSRHMTPRQGILGHCQSSPASKNFPVFLAEFCNGFWSGIGKEEQRGSQVGKINCFLLSGTWSVSQPQCFTVFLGPICNRLPKLSSY